jgi:HEAT repeat protein
MFIFARRLSLLSLLALFAPPATCAAQQPAAQQSPERPTPEQQRWLDDLKAGKEVGASAAKLYYGQVKAAYPLYFDAFAKAEPDLKIQLLGFMANRKMPQWEKALHLAAADDRAALRVAALRYFHYLDADAETINRLQTTLGDGDREVRWMAAQALAKMPKALDELYEDVAPWLEGPDPLLHQPLLANIVVTDESVESLEPFWLLSLTSKNAMTRMAAAEGLQRMRTFDPTAPRNRRVDIEPNPVPPLALRTLLLDLGHEDPVRAGATMYALDAVWHPELEKRVVALLKSNDFRTRARAAEILRKRKVPFDPSALMPSAADEATQLFVLGTLGRVQTEACVKPVAAYLSSDSPAVRQAAVYALENLPGEESGVALNTIALKHDDPNVRRRAAIVLGRRGDKSAHLPPLVDREKLLSTVATRPERKFDRAPGKIPELKDGVFAIESHKQLFVDDLILESLGTSKRTQHSFKKDPRNPVFEQEYPWERQGVLNFVSSVLYDPQTRLFTAWYHSMLGAPDGKKGELGRTPLIAYSADGIKWERPLIGATEYLGSKTNNVVPMANNIVPIPDAKDPAKRFAGYLYHPEKNAMAVAYSPDGLSGWSEFKAVCGGGRDVVTACRDELGGGYFSFMKWRLGPWNRRAAWAAWGPTPDAMTRGPININADLDDDAGSADRIAAAYPVLDFVQANQFHTEIYEVTPFIYEGHYFGLPMRFDVSGKGGGNVDGLTDVMLIASRDKKGVNGWQRPGGREAPPLLALGKWGEWDSGQIYGPNGLLVVDDEIVFYYTGCCFGHEPAGSKSDGEGNRAYRAAIGRATLRLDGLVSLRADAEATITTKLVTFTGSQLQVNAACPQGSLRVELRDALGNPIPGFTFADCDPFTGDALRHIVAWHGKTDLSALAGKPIQVRLQLRNGDLYAMQFTAPAAEKK